MSRFILLGLKASGLKSLEHNIELQFYNHDLKGLTYDKSLVKAIYGTNGEGKTAIAHTLELYRNSVINGEYLAAQSFNGSLRGLINQHLKKVNVDLYFGIFFDKNNFDVFHHIIEFKEKDDRVFVAHERISYCKGKTWGNIDNEVLLFDTKDGVIVDHFKTPDKKIIDDLENRTRNLLTGSSIVYPIMINTSFTHKKVLNSSEKEYAFAKLAVLAIVLFALSLNVFIDKDDVVKVSTERLENRSKTFLKAINPMQISDNDDVINSNEYEEYAKEITKIKRFLKVFKPDLEDVDIRRSDARGGKLICKKTLIYKNGDRVDLEYESTGIKKLVRIFSALSTVDSGGVVFVDEFDANIHDVYLCKLVEYFLECTNGQFIFTTHNLGPMEVLDKKGLKHSIDFINNQKVTPWRRNGNYSVVNVYRNGMVPNSPFNINSVDFVKVFGGGKKDEW